MPPRLLRAPLAVALLFGFAAPALAQDAEAFREAFDATPNSWERRALVAALDPADDRSRKLLTDFVLKTRSWYLREAACEALAKLDDPKALDRLDKKKDAFILEGVALSYGLSKNRERIPRLVEHARSKHPQVRRAVAIALGHLRSVAAVQALLDIWEKEKEFEVWVHILESLEQVTGEEGLSTLAQWKAWWETVGGSWSPPDPDAKRPVTGGERIRTQVRGTNIDLRTRGRGLPLLVLPEYGYEKDYLQTWFRGLEEHYQLLYLDLPGATDFVDPPLKPAPDLPDPYYPLERIVDALEELHAQLVKEKKIQDSPFALVAHGLTCWIAMTYAARHPKRVRRMLLIAPYSGGAAWDAGRERVEATGNQLGDLEMVHFAQNQIYDNYETQSEAEDEALERKEWTCYFADNRDLEIGRLWGPVIWKGEEGEEYEMRKHQRALGTVVIPEFEQAKLPRTRTPTLVIHGDRSVRTSLEDAQVVAKHYGGKVARFPKSARAPFIEEHERFVKVVRKFLKK